MIGGSETTREVAKAVQGLGPAIEKIAGTTGLAIEKVSQLCEYVGGVLGTTPEDVVGLLGGDYLRLRRIENLHLCLHKMAERLKDRGVTATVPLSPRLAIPAFEAMREESDETLQNLWATLLANAMDPDQDISLQRILIDTLKQFEPIDVRIFARYAQRSNVTQVKDAEQAAKMEMRLSLFQVSTNRLVNLRCLMRPRGSPYFHMLPLGDELALAIKDNGAG